MPGILTQLIRIIPRVFNSRAREVQGRRPEGPIVTLKYLEQPVPLPHSVGEHNLTAILLRAVQGAP